jgi:hypothetical protein
MALWRHFDIRAAENSFSLGDCSTASLSPYSEKKFKSSTRTSSDCDQFGFRDQFAGGYGALMPLVSGIEKEPQSRAYQRTRLSRLLLRRSVDVPPTL